MKRVGAICAPTACTAVPTGGANEVNSPPVMVLTPIVRHTP